jgi:hypothetical protein
MRELLGHRAHDFDVDRFGQTGQFLQRISGSPRLILTLDGNQERMFGWVVGGMWGAWNGSLLGVIVNLDSDGLRIVLRRGVAMAVFISRDPAVASPRSSVEDLAGADL